MPNRQPIQRSPEAEAERGFRDEFDKVVGSIAQGQGQPLDTTAVSNPRKAALWGLADPRVDPTTFKAQLMQQGFQPQDLQSMLIVQNHPELAEVYGQPVQDPAAADDLTTLAQYPFRLGMYHEIQDPNERVAEAERIHRDWLKSNGKADEPPAPAEADPSAMQTQPAPDAQTAPPDAPTPLLPQQGGQS